MQVNAEGDQLPAKLFDLFDSKQDGIEEPEILAHTPNLDLPRVLVPLY